MELNELKEYIMNKLLSLDNTEIKIEHGFRNLRDCKFRVLETTNKNKRLGPVIRENIEKEVLDEIRRKFEERYPEFKDCNPMIRCMLCAVKYERGGTCWGSRPCYLGIILEEL